jgi:hypothetical protein
MLMPKLFIQKARNALGMMEHVLSDVMNVRYGLASAYGDRQKSANSGRLHETGTGQQ